MTRDEAKATAQMFDGMGFDRITVEEFGSDTGNYRVYLWSINPAAGNRDCHPVTGTVATGKEAKLIAKVAKGKATARDREALGRIAAERANS